jgi:mRNA interferase MazF
MKVGRGQIWLVGLDPARKGELGKSRPCLVLSDTRFNESNPVLLIAPITSYSPTPQSPPIAATPQTGLSQDSSILALHIRAVGKSRFVHRLGRAPEALVEEVAELIIFVVGRGRYSFSG